MPTNFLQIASELRNRVYELLLLLDEPIGPWIQYYQQQNLSPELLRVNKVIHYEASSLFYGKNRFDFSGCTSENITSFLGQIGESNAKYIQDICIDFPDFLRLDPGCVILDEDSFDILAKIQSSCTNVTTLTTSLGSTSAVTLRLDGLDNLNVVTEALQLVNTRFGAFLHLQKIIVEVSEDMPNNHVRKMENHGWTVKIIETVEDEDSEGRFSEVDDRDYDYDDEYSEDDYDIDNDSDFWRRAAD